MFIILLLQVSELQCPSPVFLDCVREFEEEYLKEASVADFEKDVLDLKKVPDENAYSEEFESEQLDMKHKIFKQLFN